jgi:hypothetical protein
MGSKKASIPLPGLLARGVLVISALVCGACLAPTAPQLDDPESFCSRTGLFYCNSYSVPQMLPNGWVGSCAVPAFDFGGIVGYVGTTGNGGQSPAYPSLGQARSDACGNPDFNWCVAVVQCKRH